MAVASAQQGNYVAVGGVVTDVFLEGLIPRFVTLKDAQAPLIALGSLPPEGAADQSLSQVLVRFDVRPSWVRHAYFFSDLSAAAGGQAPSDPADLPIASCLRETQRPESRQERP